MDRKLKADLFMFFSFVLLGVFVYIFHVIQSAGHIRGYITGLALVIGWFILQRQNDRRLRNLWGSFMLWVIHSNVYFDVRTHYVGIFRFLKHILFCLFILYLKITRPNNHQKQQQRLNTFRNFVIILIYIYIALFPDISTNAYGNAIFSILRVFCVTILVMTRYKDEHSTPNRYTTSHLALQEFVWVFFIHEFGLPITLMQLMSDLVCIRYTRTFPYFKITNDKQSQQNNSGALALEKSKLARNTRTSMELGSMAEKGNVIGARNDVITMSDEKIARLFRNT